MDVRQATPADLDAALPLLVRFYVEEGFATPEPELRRNLDAMLRDPSCWVAVAGHKERAAGLATVATALSTEDGRLAEIQDLYVLPEMRGQGLARALVAAAMEWSAGHGCSGIEVVITLEGEASHSLLAFYAKLGFARTGRVIHARRLG